MTKVRWKVSGLLLGLNLGVATAGEVAELADDDAKRAIEGGAAELVDAPKAMDARVTQDRYVTTSKYPAKPEAKE